MSDINRRAFTVKLNVIGGNKCIVISSLSTVSVKCT